MFKTTGPISLTVVTLYCKTKEQICEHYRNMTTGEACMHSGQARNIWSVAGEHRVLTPDWCPLKANKPE